MGEYGESCTLFYLLRIVCFYVKILSRTVADMLLEQNVPYTKGTEKFVRLMDRFFDCLNVSRYVNHTRKPELEPYKEVDDWRFQVYIYLKIEFFHHSQCDLEISS